MAALTWSLTGLALPLTAAVLHGCGDEPQGARQGPGAADGGSDSGEELPDAGEELPDAGEEPLDAGEEPLDMDASGTDVEEEDAGMEVEEMDAGEDPKIDAGEDPEIDAGEEPPLEDVDSAVLPPDEPEPTEPALIFTFDETPRTTSEDGRQFAFQLSLSTAPTDDVIFPIAVSDEDEAIARTQSVTFTPTDWSARQLISIEGKDDAPPVEDGDIDYEVLIGPAESGDPAYERMTVDPLALVNEDDDAPGVRAMPELVGMKEVLETSEAGGTARLRLALRTRPREPVTIPVSSSNPDEGTVNVMSVIIAPDQWDGLNAITITGTEDDPPVADGNTRYRIELGPTRSADASYDGLTIEPVDVVNEDNDSPALVVTPQQTPLLTTEMGTTLQWVDVKLLTRPQGEVRVPVTSSRRTEAMPDIEALRFDGSSWSVPQRVHVGGVADGIQDGLQQYEIRFGPTTSSDVHYRGIVNRVLGRNYDIDTPDVLITYDGELKTTESGGTVTLNVQLTKAPTADVTVPLTVRPTAAGTPNERLEGTLTPTTPLVFTRESYNSVRRVVIAGSDDALIDGDQPYLVQVGPPVSRDRSYDARAIPDLTLINEDDDSAGLLVTMVGPIKDGRLFLAEPGPSDAALSVRLATQPAARVSVIFTSSDPSEGTPPAPLVFVPSAPGPGEYLWSDAQTVRVEVVDDTIQDGPVDFHVSVRSESEDAAYDTLALEERVIVRTFDDGDSAGLRLGPGLLPPTELAVTEPAGSSTFTLRLTSQPTSAVTIPIVSSDLTEGRLSEGGAPLPMGGIVIEPAAWNTPRTITLSAVRDDIADGEQTYQVKLGPTTSMDRLYQNKSAVLEASTGDADMVGIVYDGVTLPPSYSVITRELAPREARPLRLRLTSMPSAPVMLPVRIAGPDADEATVSPAILTFTETDWDDPDAHQVVVTGVDDAIDDDDREYTVVFEPAMSMDADYNGKTPTPATLRGLNSDDADSRGISVSGGPLALFEEGTTQELTISLRSQPTAPVTIALTMSDEDDRDPTAASLTDESDVEHSALELVFSMDDWRMPKVVPVTGVSDLQRLGHRAIAVKLAVTSMDGRYDGYPLADVIGTVYDTPRTCKSALELWSMTATGTGEYELDTDLDPKTPPHFAHCDMDSDGGGWTLLSYSGDTAIHGGVPYPGQGSPSAPYCLRGAGSVAACTRGSGLPREDLPGLFAASTELAQGQATPARVQHSPYAPRLIDYDHAGRYHYGAILGDLALSYGPGTCTPFAVGTYFDISGTMDLHETPVFLAEALRSPLPGNFSSITNTNGYTWSIGNPGSACVMSSAAPASYLGTWQAPQHGPQTRGAAGSFSVWIR